MGGHRLFCATGEAAERREHRDMKMGGGGETVADDLVLSFERSEQPVASVIVLAWKTAPYLLTCLRSLLRSTRRVSCELVLVLNEPDSQLSSDVDRFVRGAVVIKSRVNLGYGGAINLGVRHSSGRYVVLLNDDTEVDPEWLEQLVETAERRAEAGAVGGTSLFFDGSIQEAGNVIWADGSTVKVGRGLPEGSTKYDFERRVDYCGGSSLLVRREVWDQLGGMEGELYYPAYYEDTDFCLRIAAELGAEVWYQPRSIIRHHESASTNSVFRDYLFLRNRELFVARWSDFLAERDEAHPEDLKAVDAAAWRAAGARPRVLLIDDQVAEPAIGSGYPRMFETVKTFVEQGNQVSIFTSLVDGSKHTREMSEMGVQVLDGYAEHDLEAVLKDAFAPYTTIVISRPHNFERFVGVIRTVMPESPIVYDAEALFHRRIERQAALELEPSLREGLQREADAMRETEAAIATEADGLVAISTEEAAFLGAFSTSAIAVHGPLLAGIEPGLASFAARSNIGFVAGWSGGAKSPNVDALAWFVREVLPKVLARVPGARLLVSGIDPPAEARRFAGPAVSFLGGVDDLAELYGTLRLAIVPMRYGAGVKNKTIEALQYAVPTVSTAVGAEGIPLKVPDALLVDDDADGFAIKVAALLDEETTWNLQRQKIFRQLESWDLEEDVWPEVFRSAARVREHRLLAVAKPTTGAQESRLGS